MSDLTITAMELREIAATNPMELREIAARLYDALHPDDAAKFNDLAFHAQLRFIARVHGAPQGYVITKLSA